MSGYTQIPIPDMDHWTTDQILAVYDVCQMISATLMARHKDQLLEKMIEIDHRIESSQLMPNEYDDNRQLSFDELP